MEFDNDLIKWSLHVWNFNTRDLSIESIQHVPMHEWRVSTLKKPRLHIENLQVCVCLYAYSNNFAFEAHINTVVFDNYEFILNKDKEPISCNRCHDLLNQILK